LALLTPVSQQRPVLLGETARGHATVAEPSVSAHSGAECPSHEESPARSHLAWCCVIASLPAITSLHFGADVVFAPIVTTEQRVCAVADTQHAARRTQLRLPFAMAPPPGSS
jgi:hypothetical protein